MRKRSFLLFASLVFFSLLALMHWYQESQFIKQSPQSLLTVKPASDNNIYTLRFLSQSDIDAMEEKKFNGRSQYQIIEDPDKGRVLEMSSEGASSMLYQTLSVDLSRKPTLSWEWKAIDFPNKKRNERLGAKSDNDYAMRVYAMFKGSTIFNSEVIQYVWDDHFVEGAYESSPYSSRVKIYVVEDGDSGGWVQESRNLLEDYVLLFGRQPDKPLSAVGIMSDSDNTKTVSRGLISNINIGVPSE